MFTALLILRISPSHNRHRKEQFPLIPRPTFASLSLFVFFFPSPSSRSHLANKPDTPSCTPALTIAALRRDHSSFISRPVPRYIHLSHRVPGLAIQPIHPTPSTLLPFHSFTEFSFHPFPPFSSSFASTLSVSLLCPVFRAPITAFLIQSASTRCRIPRPNRPR